VDTDPDPEDHAVFSAAVLQFGIGCFLAWVFREDSPDRNSPIQNFRCCQISNLNRPSGYFLTSSRLCNHHLRIQKSHTTPSEFFADTRHETMTLELRSGILTRPFLSEEYL